MARLGERLVPRLRGRGAWGNPQPGGRHDVRERNTFSATRVHSEYTAQ
jgi:hypothetical protein